MGPSEREPAGPFSACVFDMDGLLIDSEPLWKEAEAEVYGAAGVSVTAAAAAETKGLGLREVAEYWRRFHPFEDDPADLAAAVVRGVVSRIRRRALLRPGARAALDFVRERGLRIGLATSSPEPVIREVLDRFGLAPCFDTIRSAEDEARGKPDPAVYLSACAALEVHPSRAVAFEDSINGVLAAKAAGMRCVAVPAVEERNDPRFRAADLTLRSLDDLDERVWSALTAS